MKKLLYTLLVVSIIFAACKKEEGCTDAIATNYNADAEKDDGSCTFGVVGVWTPTSVVQDSSVTVTVMGMVIDSLSGSEIRTMTPEEAGFEGELEFTSDGKMLVDGDEEMDYTYSNSVLTVTDDDTTMEWACSVTSTDLSLTIEFSMDSTLTTSGIPITISMYFGQIVHFSRSTMTNNNVSQKVVNTNHSWFVKPKFNNIIKSIK